MRFAHYILIIISLTFLMDCGKKSPTKSSRIKSALNAGWDEFESSNMEAALEEFMEAFNLDSTRAQSQVAVAWARLMVPGTDPATVISAIDSNATDDQEWRNDAWCALAVAHLILNQYSEADSVALLVLTADPAYVFAHRPSVDWQDLLLIQGQALFFMAQYTSAWQVMGPLLTDPPYASIDPANPSTWKIGNTGKTYNMFAEIVAKVISALVEVHRL